MPMQRRILLPIPAHSGTKSYFYGMATSICNIGIGSSVAWTKGYRDYDRRIRVLDQEKSSPQSCHFREFQQKPSATCPRCLCACASTTF